MEAQPWHEMGHIARLVKLGLWHLIPPGIFLLLQGAVSVGWPHASWLSCSGKLLGQAVLSGGHCSRHTPVVPQQLAPAQPFAGCSPSTNEGQLICQ